MKNATLTLHAKSPNIGIRRGGKYANGVVPEDMQGSTTQDGALKIQAAPEKPAGLPPVDLKSATESLKGVLSDFDTDLSKVKAPAIGIRPGGKYADGVVPNPPGMIERAQNAVRGIFRPTRLPPSQPSAAATVLQPVVNAVTDNTGMVGQAAGALQRQNQANEEALNLADGAAALKGPGTETSDSIPVHLSRGESVLPAATTEALGTSNIKRMIEATNGKPPKIGIRPGGRHADGVVDNWVPGAKYGRQMAQDISAANTQGGAGAAVGQTIRGIAGIPGAVASDVVRQYAEPVIRPWAQALKTAVTGDPTPIGQEPANEWQGSAGKISTPAPVAPVPVAAPAPTATPSVPPIGVRRAAPRAEPLPILGGPSGTGYVKNDQTGATYVFKPPAAAAAPAAAAPAAANTPEARARAYAQSLAQPGDAPEIFSSHFNEALRGLSAADLQAAQTAEAQQNVQKSAQLAAIQKEMATPGIAPERMLQLRETMANMTGRELYKPMATVDAMGNPTTLFNTQTGQMMQPGTPAAGSVNTRAGAPTFGSVAELKAAKAAGKIKSGDIVNTPNGPIQVQ